MKWLLACLVLLVPESAYALGCANGFFDSQNGPDGLKAIAGCNADGSRQTVFDGIYGDFVYAWSQQEADESWTFVAGAHGPACDPDWDGAFALEGVEHFWESTTDFAVHADTSASNALLVYNAARVQIWQASLSGPAVLLDDPWAWQLQLPGGYAITHPGGSDLFFLKIAPGYGGGWMFNRHPQTLACRAVLNIRID